MLEHRDGLSVTNRIPQWVRSELACRMQTAPERTPLPPLPRQTRHTCRGT